MSGWRGQRAWDGTKFNSRSSNSCRFVVASVRIELLLAIVKFDRFEWALEKATELGAEEIMPLAAERSEKGLIAAAGKRAERWKRILAESAQQARRLRVPFLSDAAKPCDAFRASDAPLKLLLSERAGARPLREVLEPVASVRRNDDVARVAIAIGPEGGWTDAEFASACGLRIRGGCARSEYSAHGNGRVRGACGGAVCVWSVPAGRRA